MRKMSNKEGFIDRKKESIIFNKLALNGLGPKMISF